MHWIPTTTELRRLAADIVHQVRHICDQFTEVEQLWACSGFTDNPDLGTSWV